MSSEESSDTWKVLEEKHVVIPTHIKNILYSLGYVEIRVLAKIDESTMKEIEKFVGKVLGSDEMTKNMSLTERQEQFGKTFASNPKSFMLLPGDKVVLRVIREVCKQGLEGYQSVLSPHEKKNKSKSTTFSSGKQFTAMNGKSESDQLTSKVDSDILVDEEETTTANKLT